jgi:DNA-binding response OmpR family regulator
MEGSMGVFRWISERVIPPAFDLRLMGWMMVNDDDPVECVMIVPAADVMDPDGSTPTAPILRAHHLAIVAGVNDPAKRARLLDQGFGDAVSDDVTIAELHARVRRLPVSRESSPASRNWLPRRRTVAGLQLDLLSRDAISAGQPLGLKPREFDLLWRLADTPNETVSKQALVYDVLRLSFEPASNSIAVHMSRLRGKLVAIGLRNLVETEAGGYRLCLPSTGLQAPWTTDVPPASEADPRWC